MLYNNPYFREFVIDTMKTKIKRSKEIQPTCLQKWRDLHTNIIIPVFNSVYCSVSLVSQYTPYNGNEQKDTNVPSIDSKRTEKYSNSLPCVLIEFAGEISGIICECYSFILMCKLDWLLEHLKTRDFFHSVEQSLRI